MPQFPSVHRECIKTILNTSPLMPVITINRLKDAVPLCQALVDGGINVLEITLRTEHGTKAIEAVRNAIPDVWVGAGTVTCTDQYRDAEAAGARFVVTPGVTESLLKFGTTSNAPMLPGIASISELMLGYALGYREFKFFPAEVAGSIPALQAFSGPFEDVAFCPTGGITRATAKDYLALKNVKAVGGTWLAPADLVAAGDWAGITDIARASLADL